jgi:hypothetical protein
MSVWSDWSVYRRFSRVAVWYTKFSNVTRTQRAFRRHYNCHHVPSRRDIVIWYNMFLENGLTMPHTGGRVRDRNREEDIRQAMIQGPRKSREFLDDTCNNHWCGRDGPIPWPAIAPDLTPPDFFVWGYVKSLVYGQRPQNEADLRQKITAAFAHITPEMLRATCCNLSARYELCRVSRGGHVEY